MHDEVERALPDKMGRRGAQRVAALAPPAAPRPLRLASPLRYDITRGRPSLRRRWTLNLRAAGAWRGRRRGLTTRWAALRASATQVHVVTPRCEQQEPVQNKAQSQRWLVGLLLRRSRLRSARCRGAGGCGRRAGGRGGALCAGVPALPSTQHCRTPAPCVLAPRTVAAPRPAPPPTIPPTGRLRHRDQPQPTLHNRTSYPAPPSPPNPLETNRAATPS